MTAAASDLALAVVVVGFVFIALLEFWRTQDEANSAEASHRRLMREIARYDDTTETE